MRQNVQCQHTNIALSAKVAKVHAKVAKSQCQGCKDSQGSVPRFKAKVRMQEKRLR